MKKAILLSTTLVAIIAIGYWSFAKKEKLAEIAINQPAPAFSEVDQMGKTHTLADYKGKWVVLEWYNKDCPYVKKHYVESKNMQTLQKEFTDKGVVWLKVNSGAKGKQGYLDAKGTLADMQAVGSNATATLIDSDGSMGRTYGAKTTPHMFVINPEGVVVYAGAIDSNSRPSAKHIPTSTNYVREALTAGLAGRAIATPLTKPYGCSVKY